MNTKRVYKGANKNKISFPLGGIGSGSIGLSGNGRLIDWEIFNKPNKGSVNGFTHFAVKAENKAGEVKDVRVLHGDLPPDYMGPYGDSIFKGFGYGPDRTSLVGLPGFKDVTFTGEFPIASLKFEDQHFPGNIELSAFNPFIPINEDDSSLPAAFFSFRLENTTDEELTYSLCSSLNNPIVAKEQHNEYEEVSGHHMIQLSSHDIDQDDYKYGELCIATNADQVSYQEYWYRGQWYDNLGIYWQDFSKPGKLKNRKYENGQDGTRENVYKEKESDISSLCAHVVVQPGEVKEVRFMISWYFPHFHKYWGEDQDKDISWNNYYAKLFTGAKDVCAYGLKNWDRLYKETDLFKEALYTSTLPEEAIEAIGANISILKTATCLRLENGEFYGWEGLMQNQGSCEGSCTHVWNYTYALPFLFPKLERSMRQLDYTYNLRDSGSMAFRLMLPLGGDQVNKFRACADGQLGGVIKLYRDWKISGDDEWLKELWPKAKKSLEFAWSKENDDRWDPEQTGVLWGRQHHTLDMELFGPNAWLTGYYLAALKAAAEIEEFLGHQDEATKYQAIAKKGKAWIETNLFNGNYYEQQVDLKDIDVLKQYMKDEEDQDILKDYWSEEHGEIKYQVGEGSVIDQVLAQWHANLCGLGEVYNQDQVKKVLETLYKHNFKDSMREHFNPCRIYSLYDEAGIVICEWPEGKYKPYIPVPYSEETMNGFEYQAAIHMIQEGMMEEGLEIVRSVRERYDGVKRNPWNEFECGSNYARSMASYGLLLTFSGFSYHMSQKMLGFNPISEGDFKSFWSIEGAWGTFQRQENSIKLTVLYGELDLAQLSLPFVKAIEGVEHDKAELPYKWEGNSILLDQVNLQGGEVLNIRYC